MKMIGKVFACLCVAAVLLSLAAPAFAAVTRADPNECLTCGIGSYVRHDQTTVYDPDSNRHPKRCNHGNPRLSDQPYLQINSYYYQCDRCGASSGLIVEPGIEVWYCEYLETYRDK